MDAAAQIPIRDAAPDPARWVDEHGDCLFRYAMFRLRDAAAAEDVVQETLLAALQSYHTFAGRGAERTWLIGILKHKIIDYFRRAQRETPVSQLAEEDDLDHDEQFRSAGQWAEHFDPDRAPTDWLANPAQLFEQGEFWLVFQHCLTPLPPRISRAFTLREVDGCSSEEVCAALSISANNLWVMLHRARTHLRRCLELNWFMRETKKS